jgi:hypothetical protein
MSILFLKLENIFSINHSLHLRLVEWISGGGHAGLCRTRRIEIKT